ncbi:tol-pal system YbgF family protein [Gemmatimonadota bacterium]
MVDGSKSPWAPKTNYEMALTYEAMGRMEEARTHIQRALEVWAEADPEYRPARLAREAAERIG